MTHKVYAYVGAYTTEGDKTLTRNARARGIKCYSIDRATGDWTLESETETLNPAVLSFGRDRKILYSIESDSNVINAFGVYPESGRLTLFDQIQTGGKNVVIFGVSSDFGCIVAADHYGLLSAISLNENGGFGEVFAETVPPGHPGPLNDIYQPHARPHSVVFTPDGKYVLIADKGLDKVHSYEIDAKKKVFQLHAQIDCRRAGCPRHIVFSPDGKAAYLNLEMSNMVVAFDYQDGVLKPFQILPTLPDYYVGSVSKTSEIGMHPSGRWLYVSNRGHNSIVVYNIDSGTRCLSPLQWVDCGGKIPRYFTVDDSGNSLLCCNQFSDNIVVFAINPHYGLLEARKTIDDIPGAVWLQLSDSITAPEANSTRVGQGIT
ncbi:MAG: lactonase family protein [Christensenellales bacterium]|jgi:6-phosphogluconolactonase